MSEKRFEFKLKVNFIDEETGEEIYHKVLIDNSNGNEIGFDELVDLLNEQQELIEELHISDHMGWGRAEKFEKELKQKKIYIKRLEYKVQKFKEMNGEQQTTIKKLQDLCGESDGENAKLRLKNKELQDKIDLLCEKYDYPKGVKNE